MQYPSTLRLFVALAVPLLAAACGSGSTQISGPSGVKCQTTVSGMPASMPANGGQVSVTVNAARECSWTASSETGWVQLSPSAGQGAANLILRVAPNDAASPRSGAILVNDARVGVRQEPAPCRYSLSGSSEWLPSTGGSVRVAVDAPSGCAWSATGASWIEVVHGSGSGDGTAEFTVAVNPDPAARNATVKVAGIDWRIDQLGAPAGPTPTPTPTPIPPTPPTPPPPTPPPPTPAPVPITLEGAATDVTGSCPALRFTLGGHSVYTDASTVFRSGSCKQVKDGRQLRVQGDVRQEGVYALDVEIRR